MRSLVVVIILLCAGCASYETPGGAVHLADIDNTDIAVVATREPSPQLPARVAVVRVQAPEYRSLSSASYGTGRFSVVKTQELLTAEQLQYVSKWPSVADVTPVDPLLLPVQLDSFEELRLAAAKLQADVLLVYTIDTSFQLKGHAYGPLSSISLGVVPDDDAYIASTGSAIFTDVRTGFTYGTAEASSKTPGLAAAWGSSAKVDRKRLDAESQTFAMLLSEAGKTWLDIVKRYQ